jgi:5-methylcytosine-specific restriction endonuclease McrA
MGATADIRNAPTITPSCLRPGRSRPPISKPMRARVLREKGAACVTCGRKQGDASAPVLVKSRFSEYLRVFPVVMTLDHIVPLADGGCSHFHNLQPMCSQCNSRKGRAA